MSLYTAETRRLAKRRFTRFFLLGVLVVLALVAGGMFLANEKLDAGATATAQAEADRAFQDASAQAERDIQACEAANQPDCEMYWRPTREEFAAESYLPSTFRFEKSFPDMVLVLASLLAVAAFIIGASFVGAEWNCGGMMNLLLWRPRRLEVLTTKLAALLVAFTVIGVGLSAVWTGVFAAIAALRGTMEGMTAGAWQSVGLTELRGLTLVLVAGALGFGLASIGRHTAVAMGVAIGVAIVFQVGLGIVLNLVSAPYAEAYLIPTWMFVWMSKRLELENWYGTCVVTAEGCRPETITLTWQMAGGGMLALVLVVTGIAMWTLRSRDIT